MHGHDRLRLSEELDLLWQAVILQEMLFESKPVQDSLELYRIHRQTRLATIDEYSSRCTIARVGTQTLHQLYCNLAAGVGKVSGGDQQQFRFQMHACIGLDNSLQGHTECLKRLQLKRGISVDEIPVGREPALLKCHQTWENFRHPVEVVMG